MPEDKHLIDIKTCKSWKQIFDPDHDDWIQQTNVYRWLLKQRGIDIDRITVVAFYMDWVESQSLRDRRYPKSPIIEYEIPVWDLKTTDNFIHERMYQHFCCEQTKDKELPKCTAKEMWEDPPEFAIMKDENAKKAMRGGVVRNGTLHDAIEKAQTLKGVSSNSYIEIRHCLRKRCDRFCAVNEYCNQYESYAANVNNGKRKPDIFQLGGIM